MGACISCISSIFESVQQGVTLLGYYNDMMELLQSIEEFKKSAEEIFKQMTTGGGIIAEFSGVILDVFEEVTEALVAVFFQVMIDILRELPDEVKEAVASNVQNLVGNKGGDQLKEFAGVPEQRVQLLDLLKDEITAQGLADKWMSDFNALKPK